MFKLGFAWNTFGTCTLDEKLLLNEKNFCVDSNGTSIMASLSWYSKWRENRGRWQGYFLFSLFEIFLWRKLRFELILIRREKVGSLTPGEVDFLENFNFFRMNFISFCVQVSCWRRPRRSPNAQTNNRWCYPAWDNHDRRRSPSISTRNYSCTENPRLHLRWCDL